MHGLDINYMFINIVYTILYIHTLCPWSSLSKRQMFITALMRFIQINYLFNSHWAHYDSFTLKRLCTL